MIALPFSLFNGKIILQPCYYTKTLSSQYGNCNDCRSFRQTICYRYHLFLPEGVCRADTTYVKASANNKNAETHYSNTSHICIVFCRFNSIF